MAARDINIGNGAITGTVSTQDTELGRIRRALEILIDEEVAAEDVN